MQLLTLFNIIMVLLIKIDCQLFRLVQLKNLKGHKRIDTMIRELIDLEIIYDNGNNYELNSKDLSKRKSSTF